MWRVLHRCLESHNIHPTLSSHSHIMFLSKRKASNSELNGIFMSWDRERKSKLDRSLRSHLISSMISWWQWYQLHPSALLPASLIGEICCFDCHLTSTPPLSPHTHSQRPCRLSPPPQLMLSSVARLPLSCVWTTAARPLFRMAKFHFMWKTDIQLVQLIHSNKSDSVYGCPLYCWWSSENISFHKSSVCKNSGKYLFWEN